MRLFLVTNSTVLPDPGGLSTRIGAKVLNNDTCVTQALYTLKKINLQLDDVIIFNEGVNDCIYRKDKNTQLWMINHRGDAAKKEGDLETLKLMEKKREVVFKKSEQELFQFLSFNEFEEYLDRCFKLFPKQGIVLSVQKFPADSKKFGWAYKEIVKTNEILERKAEEYGMIFIDLFKENIEHQEDDIHPTVAGYDRLAELVFPKVQELFQSNRRNATVCLITGGSKGLGKAMAKNFANLGYKIALNYNLDEKTALNVANEIVSSTPHAEVKIYKADVGKEDQVIAMVQAILSEFGHIDILINNAGINNDSVIWKMDKESWDKVLETNLTGAFLCTKHVLPTMRKNSYGRIIYISSVVGEIGAFGATNYSASKAGLFGLTKSVAKEVASKGITANVVACGYTNVGMGARLPVEIAKDVLTKIPLGRFGTAEEVAELVTFLTSAGYITGQIITIDGGLS